MSKAKETDVLIIIIDTHDRLLFISTVVDRTRVLEYLEIIWGTVLFCDRSQITYCLYSLSFAGILPEKAIQRT